ncbi:MAG: tRNA lysidine(34) synthetase TilS [Actinomycetota bacterium]|nr:tRNA lysidine(34) synthetase TilS [Actinomycetota bacterium]
MVEIVSKGTKRLSVGSARALLSINYEAIDKLLNRCHFPSEGSFHAAVSGGSDSLAMTMIAYSAGLEVEIWNLDHQIRPTSSAESAAVKDFGDWLGIPVHCFKASVSDRNVEASARNLRKRFFPSNISTGHTMDDQAETFILNMMRGSGIDGLSGMRPSAEKPILNLRKKDTLKICEIFTLNPVEDESNKSDKYRRNRVRMEVIPLLSEISGRDVVPVISRSASILRSDADFLFALSDNVDTACVSELLSYGEPVLARVLRKRIKAISGYPPSARSIDKLLAYMREKRSFALQMEGKVVARVRKGMLSFESLDV